MPTEPLAAPWHLHIVGPQPDEPMIWGHMVARWSTGVVGGGTVFSVDRRRFSAVKAAGSTPCAECRGPGNATVKAQARRKSAVNIWGLKAVLQARKSRSQHIQNVSGLCADTDYETPRQPTRRARNGLDSLRRGLGRSAAALTFSLGLASVCFA